MAGFRLKSLFVRNRKTQERRVRERIKLSGEYTVLIVDDSKTVVHILKTILEQGGYRILTAMNGEDGINMTRQHRPHVVLMDVIMPGMNGFQATRILSKDSLTSDIPVVIISASEQPTEEAWCKRLGAKGFLPKPISRGQLFLCLENLLDLNLLTEA